MNKLILPLIFVGIGFTAIGYAFGYISDTNNSKNIIHINEDQTGNCTWGNSNNKCNSAGQFLDYCIGQSEVYNPIEFCLGLMIGQDNKIDKMEKDLQVIKIQNSVIISRLYNR